MRIPCLALALVALASGPAALAQSYEIRNRDTDPSAVYHIKVFDGLNVRPSASFVLKPGAVQKWSRSHIHHFEITFKGPGKEVSRTFMIKEIRGLPQVTDYRLTSDWKFEFSNQGGLQTDRDWHD